LGFNGLIGMFVNTLPIVSDVNSDLLFTDFLKQMKVTTLEMFENQDCQLDDIVELTLKDRDPSRNPLFDVMFAQQNAGRCIAESRQSPAHSWNGSQVKMDLER